MTNSKFSNLVHSRRSVRKYDSDAAFDHEEVGEALELATLSPNSSNMQMWEFHRVVSEEKRNELAQICMNQNAAKTANELVVFVATSHNWESRAKLNSKIVREAFKGRDDTTAQKALRYYDKIIPFAYKNDRFGVLGLMRKALSIFLGMKEPMIREVSREDLRVCLHKSVSLAAMTFMYAMKDKGYDTCPMEGFDSVRAKRLLGLRRSDQISMIIACGKSADDGVYSQRHRVPTESVIFKH
ncbi:nitroreductase family protein [Vibrio sonorensis]|uniref:nitroreductase family protein n=1 Tax=Vibrio sonorensis TaxID=1004316 RepID=UPI0008D9C845|nr:nitroreductase family protein [Vibrio sonorensis]